MPERGEPMSDQRRAEIDDLVKSTGWAARVEGPRRWLYEAVVDLTAEVDRLRSLNQPTRQAAGRALYLVRHPGGVGWDGMSEAGQELWMEMADAVLALFSQPPDPPAQPTMAEYRAAFWSVDATDIDPHEVLSRRLRAVLDLSHSSDPPAADPEPERPQSTEPDDLPATRCECGHHPGPQSYGHCVNCGDPLPAAPDPVVPEPWDHNRWLTELELATLANADPSQVPDGEYVVTGERRRIEVVGSRVQWSDEFRMRRLDELLSVAPAPDPVVPEPEPSLPLWIELTNDSAGWPAGSVHRVLAWERHGPSVQAGPAWTGGTVDNAVLIWSADGAGQWRPADPPGWAKPGSLYAGSPTVIVPSDDKRLDLDALRDEDCYVTSVDVCCHCGDSECDGIGCIASLNPDDEDDFAAIESLHQTLREGQAWQAMGRVLAEGGSAATAHRLADNALAYAEGRTPPAALGGTR